jgi:hypothetical protein
MLLSIAWHTTGDFFVTGDYGDEKGNRIITSSLEQRIILWNKKAKRILTLE